MMKRLTIVALFSLLLVALAAPTLAFAGSNTAQKNLEKQYKQDRKHWSKMQKQQTKQENKQLKQWKKQHQGTTTVT
jgi:hypothetical protein